MEARRDGDRHRGGAVANVSGGVSEGSGRKTRRESSMAKLCTSEVAVRAAEECVQIHGGYGFVKDYPAEKYFRDVKSS